MVSLFIDPETKQINASKKTGADAVEIHTGSYANTRTEKKRRLELNKIKKAAHCAHKKGLIVNAGHGLNYQNTKDIIKIGLINEVNIGHSIISYAVFVGLAKAVKEMKKIIRKYD